MSLFCWQRIWCLHLAIVAAASGCLHTRKNSETQIGTGYLWMCNSYEIVSYDLIFLDDLMTRDFEKYTGCMANSVPHAEFVGLIVLVVHAFFGVAYPELHHL